MAEADFGEWLKEKRKERNLSQARLSDLTGISKGYLGHLEQFSKAPSQDKCKALATALMVSETEVMTLAGFYPPGTDIYLDENELEFIRQFRTVDSSLRVLVTDIIKRAYDEG